MINIRKSVIDRNFVSSEALIKYFEANASLYEWILYVWYPVMNIWFDIITLDAIWISEKYGVVIFDLVDGEELSDRKEFQDKLYAKMESQLKMNDELNEWRNLKVNIEVITYAPWCNKNNEYKKSGVAWFILWQKNFKYACVDDELSKEIASLANWNNKLLFLPTVSVIQSVIKLKPKKERNNVVKTDSRWAKLKELEKSIATLDQIQEEAIISFFDWLQRIRWLAWSWKTIILALKTALLHTKRPDFNIAVTFNTRSLKNQFKELIEKFCIQKIWALPDWDKITILQAWWSPQTKWIYYDFCIEHSLKYYDFRSAEGLRFSEWNFNKSVFENVCNRALTEVEEKKIWVTQKYDAILVDEAQDLSWSFLKICYQILKEPKRLIYAYDELQQLNEGSSLGAPKDIFWVEVIEDTMLRVCYRNSKPILTTAHALGFWFYREWWLVQFFDEPSLWNEVWYTTESWVLQAWNNVVLARDNKTSPEYLSKHSTIDDLIVFKKFNNSKSQAEWIANEIEKNLKEDELLHWDIIIINPLAITTKRESWAIRALLLEKWIKSHIAWDANADVFFEKGSIAITGINRAKGNEVSMVYIINANDCYSWNINWNLELMKIRNTLFTAITRSKAWVRVYGIWDKMDKLIKEYEEVKTKDFKLSFKYPTAEEIKKMNTIYRDITNNKKQEINSNIEVLNKIYKIIEDIRDWKDELNNYPEEMQLLINKINESL